MEKEEFLKEAMNLRVMELIKEHYKTPDESETLAVYEEIDKEFQKVFDVHNNNKYELVHGEAERGCLRWQEYRSMKDYWIGEYVLGNVEVKVRINFKDLASFESWMNND